MAGSHDPAVRDLISACQDVFSMLPATALTMGTSRRLSFSHRIHVEIGTVILREWLAFASTDAMILLVDELGARDDYMTLLYKATGWLYTSSSFPIEEATLPALSTALLQLRTQGVRFSTQLLSSLLRSEMYASSSPASPTNATSTSASPSMPNHMRAISDVMLELYGSAVPPLGFDFGYSMFG